MVGPRIPGTHQLDIAPVRYATFQLPAVRRDQKDPLLWLLHGGADASREDSNAPGARSASFKDLRGRAQRDCSASRCGTIHCAAHLETAGECRAQLAFAG